MRTWMAAMVLAVALLAGCGDDEDDAGPHLNNIDKIELVVINQLSLRGIGLTQTADGGTAPDGSIETRPNISCPDKVKAKAGISFDCDYVYWKSRGMSDAGAEQVATTDSITVTLIDDNGSRISIDGKELPVY